MTSISPSNEKATPDPAPSKASDVATSNTTTFTAVPVPPPTGVCRKQLEYDDATSFQFIPKNEQLWSDVKVDDRIRFTDVFSHARADDDIRFTNATPFNLSASFEVRTKDDGRLRNEPKCDVYTHNSSFPITEGMTVEVLARQENHINSIYCTPHLEFLFRRIDSPPTSVIKDPTTVTLSRDVTSTPAATICPSTTAAAIASTLQATASTLSATTGTKANAISTAGRTTAASVSSS